jgi:hypothetical protein
LTNAFSSSSQIVSGDLVALLEASAITRITQLKSPVISLSLRLGLPARDSQLPTAIRSPHEVVSEIETIYAAFPTCAQTDHGVRASRPPQEVGKPVPVDWCKS